MIGSAPSSAFASLATTAVARARSGRPDRPPASSARGSPLTASRSIVVLVAMTPSTCVPDEEARDAVDRPRREVGRDLDGDRRVLAVPVGERLLLGLERAEQAVERVLRLQVAQPLGVRRRDVDRDVRRARVDRAQAGEVVVGGARVRRVEVLADVEAEDAAPRRARDVGEEPLDAVVVEAEPVDERFGLGQPEEARLRVAGLRARRDGAAFDEAEAERREAVDVRGVLVEAGGEADPVREFAVPSR